jgi:hypothetical protein
MHAIECYSSEDETNDCLVAEFMCPAQAKSLAYPSLKPIHKNWQEEMKFTFDVSRCDKIFVAKFPCVSAKNRNPTRPGLSSPNRKL